MSLSLVASVILSASTAHAASRPDLVTTLDLPASTPVYAEGTYTVTVANVGTRNADNVALTIQLPATHTSPSVYVLGDLGALGGCSEVGTTLQCSLGQVRRGRSTSVSFDLALPWSADSLDFVATATTTTSESNTSNNTDSGSADLVYIDVPISGPVDVTNQHCTGTNLTAWYECTLFPSSISAHDVVFESDGSISFPLYPGYEGTWEQDSDDHLRFAYTYAGDVVAEFEGNGVDADCFEGLTLFPGSSYVSPYEVCLY